MGALTRAGTSMQTHIVYALNVGNFRTQCHFREREIGVGGDFGAITKKLLARNRMSVLKNFWELF